MSLDPACFASCLEFIRVAIAEAFRTTAHEITAVLKEVCTEGDADRAAIWSDLTETEQQQFQELLAPPVIARDASPQNPRGERLQFLAVAVVIERELSDAIDAAQLTAADVLAVVGETEFTRFKRIAE